MFMYALVWSLMVTSPPFPEKLHPYIDSTDFLPYNTTTCLLGMFQGYFTVVGGGWFGGAAAPFQTTPTVKLTRLCLKHALYRKSM
jgi:hypothetical protein